VSPAVLPVPTDADGGPPPDAQLPQERRWWRRVFGGEGYTSLDNVGFCAWLPRHRSADRGSWYVLATRAGGMEHTALTRL
jgi:hypothetical protein